MSSVLLDALKDMDAGAWDAANGQPYAWIAGEQSVVRDLRRHLIEDRGLDKAWIDFTGYWKRETVDVVEGDAAVPDSENHESSFMKFHELAETLPAHAVKAAANLGIGELISRGTTTVTGLVEATGADDRALRKFLRYLEGIELLEPVGEVAAADGSYWPEEYRLTSVGEYLANDMIVDHLKDGGVEARKALAFAGVEQAVRTGGASYEDVAGLTWEQLHEDPSFTDKVLELANRFAAFIAQPLAESPSLSGSDGGRILLLEETQDIVHSEGPDEHGGEHHLQNLVFSGGGFRTVPELEAVITDAGLKVASAEIIGWGAVLRTLTPA